VGIKFALTGSLPAPCTLPKACKTASRPVTAEGGDPAPAGVTGCQTRATFPAHSWTHPEGWRDWPFEAPATSRTRERCQFLRDVAEELPTPPPRTHPADDVLCR